MRIYIDNDCRCHLANDGTMRAVETDFFDGKCQAYIEGFRYVPEGETWRRADGEVFHGIMISAAEDSERLEKIQAQYEADMAAAADMAEALEILGVSE